MIRIREVPIPARDDYTLFLTLSCQMKWGGIQYFPCVIEYLTDSGRWVPVDIFTDSVSDLKRSFKEKDV